MRNVCWILAIACLAGCASIGNPRNVADTIAQQHGLLRADIHMPAFTLRTYGRNTYQGPLRVYIEGDGFAWATRFQLSSDPTPHDPIALKLAAIDPSPNVIYIARPCQYHDFSLTGCNSAYWSDKRFAPETVEAIDQAISQSKHTDQRIELIGYSGGGAIAVLLAAKRHDVSSVRTVAGNLDHERVNQYHQVDPLAGSLNPISVASQLRELPQLHFIGGRDDVIPPFIAKAFLAAEGETSCAQVVEVSDASHQSGWTQNWPILLDMALPCAGKQ